MSATQTVQTLRSGLGGRWQIPLFIAGASLFAVTIGRQVKTFTSVPFAEHLARVARLHDARELTRASMYVKDLLKNPRGSREERAELHRLYAKTAYLAESSLFEHQRQNIAAIVSNYKTAIQLRAALTSADWLALGDAYRWSHQHPESIDALRRALAAGLAEADRVRRQIIEMETALARVPHDDVRKDLADMLADEHTCSANYVWAMVQMLDRLLEAGSIDAAEELLKNARLRLAKTPEEQALIYAEALCLHARGQSDEAEASLRAFRDQLAQRDEYWAKSGWLLGRIQQQDARPQLALAFYDEVLNVFSHGPLRGPCQLGRAESLAALGRYDAALDAFRDLGHEWDTQKSTIGCDKSAVRMTLASIAEALRQDDQIHAAIDYLAQALDWTPKEDQKDRSEYMGRMADGCSVLAAQLQHEKKTDEARTMRLRAAQLRAGAAELDPDEGRKIKLLELAADDYDAAGKTDLALKTLAELAARHPRHSGRPTALFRLAQAYRSQERYREAISTFDEIMTLYPRMPDAIRSMVPLADCLLHLDVDRQKRGVAILNGIVEGTGGEQVFTPAAIEYRQALFTLAEFLSRADEKHWPKHHELAISRLEDALSLYPEASEAPKLNYLLADAYRQSGMLLRNEIKRAADTATRQRGEEQGRQRITKAAVLFERVIKLVAGEDASSISSIEETYLQSSYLYRGDCYFELGEYGRALEAYREAVWRYENLSIAISAGIQEYHCLQRLGRAVESQSALGRLRWLLKKMPAAAFDESLGMSSKSYWQGLLDRLEQTGLN